MPRKYTTCPHCHEKTRIRTFAPDRVELEKEKGERFQAECTHCHKTMDVHVNQVLAEPNYLAAHLVTFLSCFIWFIIIFGGYYRSFFLLLLATSFLGLPFAFRRAAERLTASFNDYEVKATR